MEAFELSFLILTFISVQDTKNTTKMHGRVFEELFHIISSHSRIDDVDE